MAKTKGKAGLGSLGDSATHLLHRVLQRALDFHTEASGSSGLTQRQFAVLSAAGAADGMSQSDLVRATGIDRSTLADLVARMIAKGLLQRERSAADARANTVRLSEAGRTALAEGAAPAAAADVKLLGLLAPKKRDTFLKSLAILADAPKATAKVAKADKPSKKKKKKPKKTSRPTEA
jgi:DNA-binding MarR family transcriptional regulator